jgi:hypothetical protein
MRWPRGPRGDVDSGAAVENPSSPPAEVRFHKEPRGRDLLPFASSAEHRALVQGALATSRERPAERSANVYALLPDTLGFLGALLDTLSPKVIMEFGSGESTVLFAKWLVDRPGELVSIEHDRAWVAEVQKRIPDESRRRVRILHLPLRLARRGLRQFLTYSSFRELAPDAARAQLFLLDGPHISGREIVIYFALTSCRPGAVIVIDDFRHYAVRDMLLGIPGTLASCFEGEAIDDNSHGLYVLRCVRTPVSVDVPSVGLRSIARSYWRCLRDYRQYGTGD